MQTMNEFPCPSVSKQGFVPILCCKSDCYLHENETAGRTHFDMNVFTHRPVLIQLAKGNMEMGYCCSIILCSPAVCVSFLVEI